MNPPLAQSLASNERSAELDTLAARVVNHFKAAPCAVVACAFQRQGHWHLGQGAFGSVIPQGTPVRVDTLFDLASVSKPFTAIALARLVRQGLVSLATELGVLVREAQETPSEKIPLELLAAHRAGLEAHRPLYAPLEQGLAVDRSAGLRECASARRPDCKGTPGPEGFPPLYSDLGYLLLGEAIARASGHPLDCLLQQEVLDPLGLEVGSARQWQSRTQGFVDCVAPTEIVEWRGGLIKGVVHDENAWALNGSASSGHAGLFGSARDVALLGAALLDILASRRNEFLRRQELDPLIRLRPGGTLRAGFDGKSETASSAGVSCSKSTFGHLGFTGTSLWIDPDRSVAVCLLSNRVHPTRYNDAIKVARPDINEALFAWAERAKG